MDFTLTDEQRLLKDSVDRLMVERYAFDQRKNYIKADGKLVNIPTLVLVSMG
jgi:ABC-type transporter lipoprotein component MlaA